MKPTIKQLQETIKDREKLIKDCYVLICVYKKEVSYKDATIKKLRARIKLLSKALIELERDYEALKRKRK